MTPTHPRAEEWPGSVVAAAVRGEPDAVRRLLADLQPIVTRFCRARIGRTQGGYVCADDVAQEVIMGVLIALPTYRGGADAFLAFVFGIARNKITDFHRARGRDRSVPFDEPPEIADEDQRPEQHVLRAETGAELSALLDVLVPNQREIVLLRVIVGLSTAETARALSASPGAIRVAQHRALSTLRKRLNGQRQG